MPAVSNSRRAALDVKLASARRRPHGNRITSNAWRTFRAKMDIAYALGLEDSETAATNRFHVAVSARSIFVP
jgi:hypothetical protein